MNRSIPAHTGKPRGAPYRDTAPEVYPRPHGEAATTWASTGGSRGLSPPTRGSLHPPDSRPPTVRSIPAHTGKPRTAEGACGRTAVYPRPHGEATSLSSFDTSRDGLSPPTRGSQHAVHDQPEIAGSIPAHTGKPLSATTMLWAMSVYPRPHGEATAFTSTAIVSIGLSPPTRGSLRGELTAVNKDRSIPAHTGKPGERTWSGTASKVYPRPHGEARDVDLEDTIAVGLSPPTRGSLLGHLEIRLLRRSIPAHTGKPASRSGPTPTAEVYPRPHGEAAVRCDQEHGLRGLSPPTRGSRPGGRVPVAGHGSIPAHTGKPPRSVTATRPTRVYPRPHGEALLAACSIRPRRGLSPPTRGSRLSSRRVPCQERSIPAHTGKPAARWSVGWAAAVYPRPHGEAESPTPPLPPFAGLSPPTRGSQT